MDQGWKGLPLLINLLLLSNASGFRDGAYSNAHHHWGQLSGNMFSPRAVQSLVSDVPVYGNLPKEVGSSLFADRPLKRLSSFQFVKGHVSSRPESILHDQTAPSSSVLVSLPLPLNEHQAGSLPSLQGSLIIPETVNVSTQGESTSFPTVLGTSGLSTSNLSSTSLYMSTSQENSDAKSAEATLPVSSQESISNNSSSAADASYISQSSPVQLSEGSDQSISSQDQSSYGNLSPSQSSLSPYSPDSYDKLSSSGSSQSTSDLSTQSLYDSSSQGSSGSLGAYGTLFQVASPPQSQIANQLLPSHLVVSSQSIYSQSSPSLFVDGSKSTSDSQSMGPALPLDTPGSLSLSFASTQTQGSASTSQATSGFASQELSSTSSGSIQAQGTTGQFAPGSPSSYPSVSLSSTQSADSQSSASQSSQKRFTSSYGTHSGSSRPLTLQGSTTYGGSHQPQVYHYPHPKVLPVNLLQSRVHGSSLPLAMALRQGPLKS
ncbi:uncharacterized protein [Pseudorasbora parva]|uniref:uncharacterized protein n=1 Tax=Pseudorasbora parva TaxID=51549 RepID=UPI00351EA7CA